MDPIFGSSYRLLVRHSRSPKIGRFVIVALSHLLPWCPWSRSSRVHMQAADHPFILSDILTKSSLGSAQGKDRSQLVQKLRDASANQAQSCHPLESDFAYW